MDPSDRPRVYGVPAPDQAAFRAAMASFATGVTVVGTPIGDGELHATTANSFASVSLDPMLVLVCLGTSGHGLAAIVESGVFSVNVLGEHQRRLSQHFADRRREPGTAGFATTAYVVDELGCPRFDGSLASFACRVEDLHPAGDHAIVVGEVLALQVGDVAADPLVFHGGRYRGLRSEHGLAAPWTLRRGARAS